jgi:hypothetical protein
MIRALLLSLALAGPAAAQYFPSPAPTPNCVDALTIEDAGEGRAVVRYYNHVNGCSTGYTDKILTTPNGISVSVDVQVNAGGAENQEGIWVTPLDEGMHAYPPEGLVIDGDTLEIIVQGGLS